VLLKESVFPISTKAFVMHPGFVPNIEMRMDVFEHSPTPT
jgi:hypothetical protein